MKVRVQEQWKPHGTHPTVSGYLVYAYEGHPLLGEVRNTRRTFKKKSEADKYASALRKLIRT